jgi:hypothetical protein
MDPVVRRLCALFIIGLLALCSPVLVAFNRPVYFCGLPLLPLYLFVAWGGLILVTRLLAGRHPQ